MMKDKSLFERDFVTVEERFPKLKYSWSTKYKTWVITGELDICDTEGVYWNTFNIVIGVPQSYPYCVPILVEKSEIIIRDIDWHISPEGICCIDVSHNLIAMSKLGINICSFISDKVYPYFANQLYKLAEDKYAGKEYAHHLEGIIQYYLEEHNLPDKSAVVSLLQRITTKSFIGRNNSCPCGSGKKIKRCHKNSIETIKSLGDTRLLLDLKNIENTLSEAAFVDSK